LELTAGPLADLVSGSKPWTLDLTAEMAGAKLSIRGAITEPIRGKGIAVDFDLAGPSMKELEVLVGTELPSVRTFDLRGHIEEVEGKYRLVDLAGNVAATGLTGSFEADLSKDKPILNGSIDIQRIDAWPVLAAIQEEELVRADDQAAAPDLEETRTAEEVDLDAPFLTLDPLGKLDARFSLTVHEVANLATGLRDANLDIQVEDGKLSAPMSVILAGVPFRGEVTVAPVDGQPRVAVMLGAEGSTVGELAKLLTGARGIEGKFDSAQLGFQARGESIRNLIGSSELRFSLAGAALSYGHDQVGAKSVEFTLEEAHMFFPAAAESRITAVGTLLGTPFSVEARGGTFIENFIDRSWPVQLKATGSGAQIDIDGTVRRAQLDRGSQIAFSLVGEPMGDLAAWVGVSPQATQSYELTGHLSHDLGGLRIQIDQARIGDSSFAGEVGNKLIGDTRETFAQLDFDVLDLARLDSLLPKAQGERTPRQGKEALSIDVPILPRSIEFFDSDIDLSFERIGLKTTAITEVRFSSKIEQGFLDEAPIELVLAGSRFEGKLGADFRGEVPTIDLWVASASVDIGALLAELGVAEGFDLTAGDFELKLALEGSSLRQLLERSSFSVAFEDGLWRIADANTRGILDIRIPVAQIEAAPRKRITLNLDGRVKRIPVKMRIKTDSLASFAEPKKRLKMEVDATMTNADLNLIGVAPLPVRAKNLHFRLDLRGDRLSEFDRLLEVSLPPVGPYRLQGQFGTHRTGYYVKNLTADVGRSNLSGKLDLNTLKRPPRLAVDLVARRIQLDDFKLGEWSATESAEHQAKTKRGGRREKRAIENRPLLSPEVLHSLNAKISVRARSVESGDDWLGSGNLVARLQDGRVAVEPLTLEIPGGSIDMGLTLRPGIGDFGLEARAKIEKLDYGILARRIDPDSDTGGFISLDLGLKTRGPDLERVMYRSNGHIDFALVPKDLNAGVFDLWAINLFTALMPSLDDDAKSKVNCLVARFEIRDGVMRPNALLIDSSRIQASGDGVINFRAKTIDFLAKPKSKRPQMFSAKTPVQVRGAFSDFKVGLPPGALVGTVIRMISSPVVVPFQWVFSEQEPADGRIACRKAWEAETPIRPTDTSNMWRNENTAKAQGGSRGKKGEAEKNSSSEDALQPGSGF
jgi:hypothetical protein